MSESHQDSSALRMDRRTVMMGMAATAVGAIIPLRLLAQEPVMLAADDPVAVAVGYVPNVTAVDAASVPTRKPDAHCGNCTLYVKAQEKDAHAPCGAVGGKWVASAGWCKVWVGPAA